MLNHVETKVLAMSDKRLSHTEKIIHKTGSSPFSLHRTVIEPGQNNALYLHCHPEAEFFLLEKGTLDFYVESEHIFLHAGDGIFIPPGMLHNALRPVTETGICRYSAIVFSTGSMERCFPSGTPYFEPLTYHRSRSVYVILLGDTKNKKLLSGIKEILKHRNEPPASCELALQGLLFVCWQELYNLHLTKIIISSGDDTLRKDLLRTMDHMQKHYHESLTLEQLSQIAGYSQSYYCHSFKRLSGNSPFDYLNRIRIVNACELLSTTNKKITEVASLVGFNNISYFNRIFTRIMGATPSAYRKNGEV